MPEPKPVHLVQQLEEALYGESVARPVSPQEWWHTLLDVVARKSCTCSPDLPPHAYDCRVCQATHDRHVALAATR